ncbi:hypothetical protein IAT40_005746 [Kwoniella sp. CBS 6097]
MADEEGNIKGLIDWEWAFTTTKAEAFATPVACQDVQKIFLDGVKDLTPTELQLIQAYEELGRPDLADCARNGRIYHWLRALMGQTPDMSDINGIRDVLGLEKYKYETIDEWVEEMKVKHKADVGLQELNQ